MTDADPDAGTDSIVIPFRDPPDGEPVAVVIGPAHAPYYLYRDGRREPTSPGYEPGQP